MANIVCIRNRYIYLTNAPSIRSQQGVTLIEVLIALLVLSVGLLGVAALQTNALKANQSSLMRSHATNLSYDISDRMRANRQDALDGAYLTIYDEDEEEYSELIGNRVWNCPTTSGQRQTMTSALNSLNNVADRDLAEFKVSLQCSLPNGRTSITRDGDEFVIRIRWDNERNALTQDEEVEDFVTRVQI